MIQPPYLKNGDAVGIVAPASYVAEEELESAFRIFSSWGLHVIKGKNLYKKWNSFAGSDVQRISDFQDMLDHPEVKAVICARGGYGTIRIIDKLSFNGFCNNPKWIVGCSDITVLHAAMQQHAGVESLHAIMPRRLTYNNNDNLSLNSLKEGLFGDLRDYPIRQHPLNIHGESSGTLLGGNLSVLYSMRGSKYDPDTEGKILFLEDVGEYLYHIDRMMMNLKVSHKLDRLKGLIVGGMNQMKISDSGFRKPAYQIIHEAVQEYGYPVAFGAPSGHISPNMAMIFGRHVHLNVNPQGTTLEFET